MSKLQYLIAKSAGSSFYKTVLNLALDFTIPFNSPHHYKVLDIKPGFAHVLLPFRRSNKNHVNSLHACALATLCEFTTGLALVGAISEQEYRIILKNLNTTYLYQGKRAVTATFELSEKYIQEQIITPLKQEESVTVTFEIHVKDDSANLICSSLVTWQIKNWSKVRLKS